jgi:hypothetical protein
MTSKPNTSPTRVAVGDRPRPVRVRVFRADGKLARVHPPDGEAKKWLQRLNKALGTTSSDFVNASLFQIQAASNANPISLLERLYRLRLVSAGILWRGG